MTSYKLNLKDIYTWSAEDELISKIQEWGAIAAEGTLKCIRCGGVMRLHRRSANIDGYMWSCLGKIIKPKKKIRKCEKYQSLRFSTFFQKSQLTLEQIVVFCFLWVRNIELQFICDEIRVSKKTAVAWNYFCREIVIDFCLRRKKPIGGKGMTVEIDEAKFGKRKYHRERFDEGQWVFGGICRETGEVFMVPVEHRDASTLILLVENWIMPGSTLISDIWKEYDGINEATFAHLKASHSMSFEDEEERPPGNTGKGLWRYAKRKLPDHNKRKCSFAGYFAKFLFMQSCKIQKLDPTVEFFHAAGQLYNPYSQDAKPPEVVTQDSDNSGGEGPSNGSELISLCIQIKEEELSFSEDDDVYT